jgi:iron(III) transport system ATP-binding protein
MGQPPEVRVNAVPRKQAAAGLTVQSLRRNYGRLTAVRDVSLQLAPGEIVCLLGSSGCGKSTLLRLIAGLEQPDAGTIAMDGAVLSGPGVFIAPERRGIGMVFQDYALFPHLNLLDNVGFGIADGTTRRDTAHAALARVQLGDRAGSFPHMLSGGEQQRVALARALAPEPRLLLLDEPFSNLDRSLREAVRDQTLAILREAGITALLVTHDPDEALRIADRIVLMRAGRVEQDGAPEALYRRPASLYAARFFGGLIELPAICSGGRLTTPLGSFAAPGMAEGAGGCVAFRPHDVRPAASGIPARLRERSFQGAVHQLRLDVAGLAEPLSLQAFEPGECRPGDTIHLEVNPGAALVFPVDPPLPRSNA